MKRRAPWRWILTAGLAAVAAAGCHGAVRAGAGDAGSDGPVATGSSSGGSGSSSGTPVDDGGPPIVLDAAPDHTCVFFPACNIGNACSDCMFQHCAVEDCECAADPSVPECTAYLDCVMGNVCYLDQVQPDAGQAENLSTAQGECQVINGGKASGRTQKLADALIGCWSANCTAECPP